MKEATNLCCWGLEHGIPHLPENRPFEIGNSWHPKSGSKELLPTSKPGAFGLVLYSLNFPSHKCRAGTTGHRRIQTYSSVLTDLESGGSSSIHRGGVSSWLIWHLGDPGVASQPPRLLSPLTLSMLLIWAVKPPLLTGTLSPVPHSGAQAGGLGGSLLWWWSWPEQALWELACLPCSLNWCCLLLFSYPASCWSCISTLTPAFPLPGVPYTPPKIPNNHTAAPLTPPWCPGCQKPLLIPSEQDVFFCCPSPCLLLVTTWHISYLSIYSLYSLPWM